jgi:tetratricopeptide (TPR) repeat protein
MWLAVVIAAVSGSLVGGVWWQERPLHEAEALLETGDARGAIRLVNRFLREHPSHGRAQGIKARALVEVGDPAAAIALFEQAGAQDARELHAWARALVQQQQWSAAAPLLERVLAARIDQADVLLELTACRAKLGEFADAREAAREYASLPGCEARGLVMLGALHKEQDKLRDACAAWERVLELCPEGDGLQVPAAEFFYEFGRATLLARDPVRAIELLERSRQFAPQADTLLALGEAYSQSGRIDEASDAWREAVSHDPEHVLARLSLANLALGRRDVHEAQDWLRPLEASANITSDVAFSLERMYQFLDNADEARRWRTRGEGLLAQEEVEKAVYCWVRDKPDSSWARVIRAYRFAEAGNWIEAERMLGPVLPSSPEHGFVMALSHAIQTRGDLPELVHIAED